MLYKKLWGKSEPHHPLWCHLLDAAAVCEALLPRFGGIETIPDVWLPYLVALHDIGKADPMFQMQDDALARPLHEAGLPFPAARDDFRHEARSADWLYGHLNTRYGWGSTAAIVAAQAARGHHGDFGAQAYIEEDWSNEWDLLRDQLAEVIAGVLRIEQIPYSPDGFDNASVVGVRLTGLVVLSDWIASNNELFHCTELNRDAEPDAYWSAAREEAANAVRRLRLVLDEESRDKSPALFPDLWPEHDKIRPSQRALQEICLEGIPPGLAIIEAPMGEGKTEAAVYLAECWNRALGRSGAYIALPTMATSNAMHRRYKKFLHRYHPKFPDPYLVHGMAWILDDTAPENGSRITQDGSGEEEIESREWFRSAKRALLALEAVGTIDQALMAALNVRHGFLRLLGLTSKTLILDEVHACDEYMSVLLARLLQWCGALGVPVIMLSATLASEQKRNLARAYRSDVDLASYTSTDGAYPLLTFVPLDGRPVIKPVDVPPGSDRTIQLRRHPGLLEDAEGTARLAVEQIESGGCECVLVNTVKSAQAVFRVLQGIKSPDTDIYLFHSRFRAERRCEIEDRVVSLFGENAGKDSNPPRPAKAILAATQASHCDLTLTWAES